MFIYTSPRCFDGRNDLIDTSVVLVLYNVRSKGAHGSGWRVLKKRKPVRTGSGGFLSGLNPSIRFRVGFRFSVGRTDLTGFTRYILCKKFRYRCTYAKFMYYYVYTNAHIHNLHL